MSSSQRRQMTSLQRLLIAVVAMLALIGAAVVVVPKLTKTTSVSSLENAVVVGDVSAKRVRMMVNGMRSTSVSPLRKADLITLKADVSTKSPESLWVRTVLDLGATDPELAQYLHVYSGPLPTGVALAGAMDVTDALTFPGYVGTAADLDPTAAQPLVLNGRDEKEAVGTDGYPLAVAIYVDPSVPDGLLGRSLELVAITETAPYREIGDLPSEKQWIEGPRVPLG